MTLHDFSMVKYEAVATSQSDQVMGATGKAGDVLLRVIISVSTSGANGTCSIKDGTNSAIALAPANTPIGVYVVEVGAKSTNGAWKITTGSACTAVGVGIFS